MADGAVVIKKVKKGHGHGHHGGAWKVAYADFVTAMMAFFLLMWLINTTTPEQKRGIADYFAAQNVSESTSGSGGVLGGRVLGEDGSRSGGAIAVVMQVTPPEPQERREEVEDSTQSAGSGAQVSGEALERALAVRERREFEQAEMSLRQAMQDMPDLAELSKQILIDQTEDGMRIQLVDQENRPMFAAGSAALTPNAETLLAQVAVIVDRLSNRIAISGHTDAAAFERADGYSNWDLSADRAQAARRTLQKAGVAADRIAQVTGKAGSDPLYPDDPYASANRRISIVMLREAPALPPGHSLR